MPQDRASRTALFVAVVRAVESSKPEHARICHDPYAHRFVSKAFFHLARLLERRGYTEQLGTGVFGFMVGRERHIDEYLRSFLSTGLEQLVILGAGYDARAYRFTELAVRVRVFEADHRSSQEAKLEKLKGIFGHVPEHVVYVPIDFAKQDLGSALLASGYDPGSRTLFIWQGVTQYLTPDVVDATLGFITSHSGGGSSVIFDYIYTSLLDGTTQHSEIDQMRQSRWFTQEPLTFGIPEGSVRSFLEQRGFTQVHDADAAYLHKTYFTGANETRSVAHGYAIASAVVAPDNSP